MKRARVEPSSPPLPHSAAGAAHPIMFWVLTLMALAVFAPCVIVPVYMQVEEARGYEQQMRSAIADLKAQAARNEAHIQALLADPVVNERIVRRELNQQPASEQVVRVQTPELTTVNLRVPEPLLGSDEPGLPPQPAWALAVSRWLPDWPWRELFGKSSNRNLLLVMSGGLIAAAFLLFGRSTPSFRAEATA